MEFNEFNYLLKIDTDLFTVDIQGAKTYEEYENEWFYNLNNDVPWDLISNEDGFYNGGELPGMVQVGYMTYFQDYEWYDDLVDRKLKEEAVKKKAIYKRNHIRGTYANANIDANYNPYLDVSRTFNNHVGRHDKEANQEERNPNDDHGIGNFDNDLVWDNAPYHANE
ncbi:hypothetical protein Tco_1102281 [Tanacetum coccineum]